MTKSKKQRLSDVSGSLAELREQLEAIRDELQEAYDARSDRWREGEAGEAAHAHINAIEEAINSMDIAESSIQEVVEFEGA